MRHQVRSFFIVALTCIGLLFNGFNPLDKVYADPNVGSDPSSTTSTPNDPSSSEANLGSITGTTDRNQMRLSAVSHEQYLRTIESSGDYSSKFTSTFKQRMLDIARNNVLADNWVVPGTFYPQTFVRDSFWMLLALQDPAVSQTTIQRFRDDQRSNSDGHIATALYRNRIIPPDRDRDDESAMMYVLNNLVYQRLGGTPDKSSLQKTYDFIASHVSDGKYYTTGETRFADSQGGYHYWADTLKAPRGVIAYNQGLLAVSLRALDEMGIAVDHTMVTQAQAAYRNMRNPADNSTLPLMEGSTITDVSALTGEALSLLLYNEPILDTARVKATTQHLLKYNAVYYPDGKFLGFKVIADYYGGYRPTSEFLLSWLNTPGNYQNGSSWFLYDMLALYTAARHDVPGAANLMLQRMQSEFRYADTSHEFINTSKSAMGYFDKNRDDYGWNAAIVNLLP